MGIRLYFERISSDNFSYLCENASAEAYKEVISSYNELIDNWNYFMSDEAVDYSKIRRLIIEKFFWEELLHLLTEQADDELPTWNILGEGVTFQDLTFEPSKCAQYIGDFWMGYSPLYYIKPSDIKDHINQLNLCNAEILQMRFRVIQTTENKEEAEELEQFLEGLLNYYVDVLSFFKEAQQNSEAILWYIG